MRARARAAAGPPPATVGAAAAARPTLALVLAFVSGLTSLGYQVLWTRLLSSGTGNSTYVFTLILGDVPDRDHDRRDALRRRSGRGSREPIGADRDRPGRRRGARDRAASSSSSATPAPLDPGDVGSSPRRRSSSRSSSSSCRPRSSWASRSRPSSTLLGDDPARIAANAGRLLAANTAGSITATFVIPFFVIPLVGSPHAVALLALVNVATAHRARREPAAAWRSSGAAVGDRRGRRGRRRRRDRRRRSSRRARSSTRASPGSGTPARRSSPATRTRSPRSRPARPRTPSSG